ncbi:MAG: type II toxin-antitoxin system HicA family toxin [Planctomycetes bacterium]|nr:type II toxin-antitoxin system HicA family toxin [Planctomycetota bacterium]
MGKLRNLSGREVRGILEAQGFAMVRQHGSHMVLQRSVAGATQTAIVPNHKSIRAGTLSSIIRQSGIPRSEFEVKGS